jgi:hypothetical protein
MIGRGVIVLAALALSSAALAQRTVTGVVTNAATGANLEGARNGLQGTAREVLTFRTYRFDQLPAGNVVLPVSYTGLKQGGRRHRREGGRRDPARHRSHGRHPSHEQLSWPANARETRRPSRCSATRSA